MFHATNIGRQFRPDNPLLPNYKWVPIGYHGRSSSIGVSGESFHRPVGQTMAPGAEAPALGPSRRLDIELELGIFVGPGNAKGTRIAIAQAEDHVFGICLLNDWSARDLQAWEYQPLGPLLSKNFATTLSPWVVTLEALAPFRTEFRRPAADLQPGDLFGSGTLSGPTAGEAAALIESTQGGKHPIALPGGESRTWLEDGDRVTLRGWCERPGATRIGFGECVGTVVEALPL